MCEKSSPKNYKNRFSGNCKDFKDFTFFSDFCQKLRDTISAYFSFMSIKKWSIDNWLIIWFIGFVLLLGSFNLSFYIGDVFELRMMFYIGFIVLVIGGCLHIETTKENQP